MIKSLRSFLSLGYQLFYVNKKRTENLYRELEEVLEDKGFELSKPLKKRIFLYTSQSAITNYWFSILRGYPPTEREVENGLYLGAFTPVTDDLMDTTHKTFEGLLSNQNIDSEEAVLFSYLWKKLKKHREASPRFMEYIRKTQIAQDHSLKQLKEAEISDDELKAICFNKGGYSTLLYRSILENEISEAEEAAIFSLGAGLQMLNDIFDLYKDVQNNTQTLITNHPDFRNIESEFTQLTERFTQQYFSTSFPAKSIKKSHRAIWVVFSRGIVALDQFKGLQGENKFLEVEKFSRSPLIVDMEKPRNLYKSLWYTQKFSK